MAVTVRDWPNSQINWQPNLADLLPESDGTGHVSMNLLFYLKDIPKPAEFTAMNYAQVMREWVDDANFDSLLAPSIGVEYGNARTAYIWGNVAARDVLTELAATVQYARSLENAREDGLIEKLRTAFSQDFVMNRGLDEMIDILIIFARQYMTLRGRYISNSTHHDFTNGIPHERVPDNRTRRDLGNTVAHGARIEEDLLWTVTQHINPKVAALSDTKAWQDAQFVTLYRVTMAEAIVLVRTAFDPNVDKAQHYAWIVSMINKFTEWRTDVLETMSEYRHEQMGAEWNRVRREGRRRVYLIDAWNQRGGMYLDSTYEDWLEAIFAMVHEATLHDWSDDNTAYKAYIEASFRLIGAIDACKGLVWARRRRGNESTHERLCGNTFPANLTGTGYKTTELPIVPLELLPLERGPLTWPRPEITARIPFFFTFIRRRPHGPGNRRRPPPGVAVARAVRAGIDPNDSPYESIYDEDTDDTEEEEDDDDDDDDDTEATDNTEEEEEEIEYKRGYAYPPGGLGRISSTTSSNKRKGGDLPHTPGKKVSFADQAPWAGIKLAPPPKRPASAVRSPSIPLPASKRPRRMAVSA
ncbi:hypothetical protein F5Y13DRAFT_200590 [Hypoxylon sp. FL1857]|nr:hypothetical protein F5Y13DRAFT_200590 [Hypoxylon sp. FL1857]